jgi:hypothetical protein
MSNYSLIEILTIVITLYVRQGLWMPALTDKTIYDVIYKKMAEHVDSAIFLVNF